jgi:hypothetical protein
MPSITAGLHGFNMTKCWRQAIRTQELQDYNCTDKTRQPPAKKSRMNSEVHTCYTKPLSPNLSNKYYQQEVRIINQHYTTACLYFLLGNLTSWLPSSIDHVAKNSEYKWLHCNKGHQLCHLKQSGVACWILSECITENQHRKYYIQFKR